MEEIENLTSDKLCDIIVTYRYLGINKDLALEAMNKLSERRVFGDNYQFESVIENKIKELPKIETSVFDLQSIFKKDL
mgnify:CR=1 FL=1